MKIAILGAPATHTAALWEQLQLQLGADAPCTLVDAGAPAHDLTEYKALAGAGLILLLGLAPQHGAETRAADQALRSELNRLALPYALIHGAGPAQLDNAMQAIRHALGTAQGSTPRGRWKWACDKCSDPQCEHRLFAELTAQV